MTVALPIAAFDPSPLPFIGVMMLGFLLGTAGHVYKNGFVVGLGILLIFLATVLLPLLIFAAGSG